MRISLALLLLAAPGLAQEPRDFFAKYCLDCHDGASKKGNLDLDALGADLSSRAALDRWTSIVDRVSAGEMPPPKKEQPTPDARRRFSCVRLMPIAACSLDRRAPGRPRQAGLSGDTRGGRGLLGGLRRRRAPARAGVR